MPRTGHSTRVASARCFIVNGRRTSLALEKPLLEHLRDIARREGTSPSAILSAIETANQASAAPVNLSSATRVHIATYYRRAVEAAEAIAAHASHQHEDFSDRRRRPVYPTPLPRFAGA